MSPPNKLTRQERAKLIEELRRAADNFRKMHGTAGMALLVSQTGLPVSTIRRFLIADKGSRVTMRTLNALIVALAGWHKRVFTQPVPFSDFLRDTYGARSEMCRELQTSRRSIQNAEFGRPVDRKLVAKILQLYPGRIDPLSFLVKIWQKHEGRRLTTEEVDAMVAIGQ